MTQRIIPKTMWTQHPDNVKLPAFSKDYILWWDDEIKEALYSYKDLKIQEQMWDFEWKETNSHVVKKIITTDKDYSKKHVLWKDNFLTFRIPNPYVEKVEAKLAFETLQSIPRSFDIAKVFYKKDIAPIFEVILPMTTSAEQILTVKKYYDDIIIWNQNRELINWKKIKDVVWDYMPKTINMIPLIEDLPSMSNIENILNPCIKDLNQPYMRVFLARSDPALNYWFVSAFLMLEVVLIKLHRLEKLHNINLYPIIWVGCTPFRWNFIPWSVDDVINSYPSVQTFTVQSSFKYDYWFDEVKKAVKKINSHKRSAPRKIDESKNLDIINRFTKSYTKDIEKISLLINQISKYIPKRRRRKMHIGLFGYSRKWSKVSLPRAITFCASLYSIWLPPEVFWFEALNESDLHYLMQDKTFEKDIYQALKYLNYWILERLYPWLAKKIKSFFDLRVIDETYLHMTNMIRHLINEPVSDTNNSLIRELVIQAAHYRNFIW